MADGATLRNLRSEIEELLPRDAPSVVAIGELRRRMSGLQYLGVVIDTGGPGHAEKLAAAERLVDDLAARIRLYPRDLVSAVRTGWQAERSFVEDHAAALLALPDLQMIRERIEDRIHWEYATATGTLLDEKEPAPPLDFSDIQKKYERQVAGPDLVGNRFSSLKQGVTLLLVEVGGFSTSARKANELIGRVRADLKALGGLDHYAPGLRLGFTGDVAISSEEMAALVQDLTVSSLLVVVVVVIALIIFYRWRRSVAVLFLPLSIATVLAFALASLPPFDITELNSNTAFLGSIIVGNGINFGIVQLARYVEARRAGHAIEDSLAITLWGTRKGTLSAAVAAGAAYASLVAMQFRGFRQFGVIGGLGMLLCWGATFVLAPSLIAWLDHGKLRAEPADRAAPPHGRAGAPGDRPSAQVRRRRGAADRARGPEDPSLRARPARVRLLAPAAPRHLERGRGLLGREDGRAARALPDADGSADRQRGRGTSDRRQAARGGEAPAARRDGRVGADHRRRAAAGSRREARRGRGDPPQDDAQAAREAEPRRHQAPRRSDRQGPAGTDPRRAGARRAHHRIARARRLARARGAGLSRTRPTPCGAARTSRRFVTRLREVAEAPVALGGRPARVAGGPPLTSDIIGSMQRDGPLASGLAFAGVVATVIVIFRRGLATPLVIGSLVVGVAWLLGAAMAMGIKINFVNFIAFPITFGIGVDYAVNVMARYLRDGERDIGGAIRGTGGAVGLCSLTTIVGYSSLLVAQNVGLFLFGLLAVLGEIACLTTAVVVMPAVLQLIRKSPDLDAARLRMGPRDGRGGAGAARARRRDDVRDRLARAALRALPRRHRLLASLVWRPT